MTVFVICLLGGLVAGAINTLAGNGSMITLTILIEIIGLPGNSANATNRIGVLMNTAGSYIGFKDLDLSSIRHRMAFVLVTVSGAVVGLILALMTSNDDFIMIYKWMMLLLLLVLLINPKKWLITTQQDSPLPMWLLYVMLFLLGIYGGFIQMGMGLFFLAILVVGGGTPLMASNVLKVLVVLIYTSIVVFIFAWKGWLDWSSGLSLGLGQYAGGWLTAKYGSQLPNIESWAYRLLVIMASAAILKFFLF